MKLRNCALPIIALTAGFALASCNDHLLFVEADHIGLRVSLDPSNPSPAEISLGYRRGVTAFVPRQNNDPFFAAATTQPHYKVTTRPAVAGQPASTDVYIAHDPDELTSMYGSFRANIGLMNPIEFHHFIATGLAAETLLADKSNAESVASKIRPFGEAPKSAASQPAAAGAGGSQ